jgi:hypothetical protein
VLSGIVSISKNIAKKQILLKRHFIAKPRLKDIGFFRDRDFFERDVVVATTVDDERISAKVE